MTAQKRETGKNYIGLLNDEVAEPQADDISPAAHRVKNYVLGLMAAVLNRRGEAR
ncbi:MAG: hypothetical protein PS018_10920 [bacterium]|nr:hypothetical protein [bacterium]